MFPVSLLNKYCYTKLTERQFVISTTNVIDMAISLLVLWWFFVFYKYSHRELDFDLLGPKEDNQLEVRLMRNIIYDIEEGIFHTDYLLAGIISLFWFRCLLLLKLTEQFGPLLEMIYAMLVVFMQFTTIYILELMIFSCVAMLSMSENPNFEDL